MEKYGTGLTYQKNKQMWWKLFYKSNNNLRKKRRFHKTSLRFKIAEQLDSKNKYLPSTNPTTSLFIGQSKNLTTNSSVISICELRRAIYTLWWYRQAK